MIKILILFLSASLIYAQQSLELIHADENYNTIQDGMIVTTLRGDVRFKFGDMKIDADSTTWTQKESLLRLYGRILFSQPGLSLECRDASFQTEEKKLLLTDSVYVYDSINHLAGSGDSARFFMEMDSIEIWGDPRFFHFGELDSLGEYSDTTTLKGEFFSYGRLSNSGLGRGPLQISGSEIEGVAGDVFFENDILKVVDSISLRYEEYLLVGDTAVLHFSGESLDSLFLFGGEPKLALIDEEGDSTLVFTGDRFSLFRDLGGDSLVVDSGVIRQFDANSLSVEVLGDRLELLFSEETLQSLLSTGGAEAIIYEDKLPQTLLTGDTLNLIFADEELRQVDAFGDAKIFLMDKKFSEPQLSLSSSSLIFLFESGKIKEVKSPSGGMAKQVDLSDTTWFSLQGDILEFSFSEGEVSSVSAFGSAISIQDLPSGKQNRVRADTLLYRSEIRGEGVLTAIGSVRTLYYSEENVRNEVGGDRMSLRYSDGLVREVTVDGGVAGVIVNYSKDEEIYATE